MSDVEKKGSENSNEERSSGRNQGGPNRGRGGNFKGQEGGGGGFSKKRMYFRKKVCRFCVDKNLKIDYKEVDILRRFVTEGGKIIPKRISGNCSKHQRQLSNEIKRARAVALLPYVKK